MKHLPMTGQLELISLPKEDLMTKYEMFYLRGGNGGSGHDDGGNTGDDPPDAWNP